MNFENEWDNYTSSEKELFQRACRRLLKKTFIVREKDEDNKKLYLFISKNEMTFSQYFCFMGFDIRVERDNGVAMLINSGEKNEKGRIQANRYSLKYKESVLLCCLWIIYLDVVKTGSLVKSVLVPIQNVNQQLERYGLRDEFEGKSLMVDTLRLFSQYNLLEVVGKIGEPDCLIKLFPSIQFALNIDEMKIFVEDAKEKLKKSKRDLVENEDEEEDDYED